MKKIAVTGPESSGKTTLSRQLAASFHTLWVPEFARVYLSHLDRPYAEPDLLRIARGQLELESKVARHAGELLFCDSDLLVVKIWSEEKYGRCHPWILEQLGQKAYEMHLLCYPDLPWEPDPLRENPGDRERLFSIYEEQLQHYGFPYVVLKGSEKERLRTARSEIIKKLQPVLPVEFL